MPVLESLRDLKIEALAAAMTYATRDDFASHRQNLIDSIRREVGKILRAANKGGNVEAEIDGDGDITFKYEHSSFHFLLQCRPNLSTGQFKDLYEHQLAFTVLKAFFAQIIPVLGLRDLDVFAVDFNNIFNLGESAPSNYEIVQEQLMPRMREGLSPLIGKQADIARVDFKIGWDYDARRTCYYTIECPSNEKNTTVWTTLNLRTREDIEVTVDQSLVAADIDMAYEVYCGAYNDAMKHLLGDTNLDFTRRVLKRS